MDDDDSRNRQWSNYYRSGCALISHFLHVPFPEELSDDMWMDKMRQVEWLAQKGLLQNIKL